MPEGQYREPPLIFYKTKHLLVGIKVKTFLKALQMFTQFYHSVSSGGVGLKVNKIEHVSNIYHQMSLAGGIGYVLGRTCPEEKGRICPERGRICPKGRTPTM